MHTPDEREREFRRRVAIFNCANRRVGRSLLTYSVVVVVCVWGGSSHVSDLREWPPTISLLALLVATLALVVALFWSFSAGLTPIPCPECKHSVIRPLGDYCPSCGSSALRYTLIPLMGSRCTSCERRLGLDKSGMPTCPLQFCTHCGCKLCRVPFDRVLYNYFQARDSGDGPEFANERYDWQPAAPDGAADTSPQN